MRGKGPHELHEWLFINYVTLQGGRDLGKFCYAHVTSGDIPFLRALRNKTISSHVYVLLLQAALGDGLIFLLHSQGSIMYIITIPRGI